MASVTFEELVRAGREMRQRQKHAKSLPKSDEGKSDALADARRWEGIFDNLIERPESKQMDIFSVLNPEDENPFPPLPTDSNDTPADQAYNAAMREVIR